MTQPSDDLSPALGGQPIPSDAPSLGGDAALTHLVGAMGDPNPAVRQRAIEAMETIGGERVFDLLMGALRDEDSSVVQRSVRALGWYSDQRAEEALIELSHRGSTAVQLEAIRSLGLIGGAEATRVLLNRLTQFDEHRTALSQALRQIAARDPKPLAERIMYELFERNRTWALEKLRYIRPAGLTPPLISIAGDPTRNLEDRSTAVRALGAIAHPSASPVLISIMAESEHRLAKWVVNALRTCRDRDAIDDLIALLKHSDPRVRVRAARVLGARRLQGAVPALTEALQDERGEVRKAAVKALVRILGRESISQLQQVAGDRSAEVRLVVLEAMIRMEPEGRVQMLIDALGDESEVVRAAAAWRLTLRRHVDLIPILFGWLQAGSLPFRRDVMNMISHFAFTQLLPTAEYRESLEAAQEDPDSSISHMAASVLRRLHF